MLGTGIISEATWLPSKELRMDTVAERLKARRTERGLTQQQLADKLEMAVSQYNRYEKGAEPKAGMLRRLATILECSVDYLLGIVDKPTERRATETLPEDQRLLLELYIANPQFRRGFRNFLKGGHFFDPDDLPQLPHEIVRKPK